MKGTRWEMDPYNRECTNFRVIPMTVLYIVAFFSGYSRAQNICREFLAGNCFSSVSLALPIASSLFNLDDLGRR